MSFLSCAPSLFLWRSDRAFIAKWCRHFTDGSPMQGNHLWHYFSWNGIRQHPRALESFQHNASKGYSVYTMSHNCHQKERYVKHTVHMSPHDVIQYRKDIYVVATDWSWTYVQTHEDGLGPYFVKLN